MSTQLIEASHDATSTRPYSSGSLRSAPSGQAEQTSPDGSTQRISPVQESTMMFPSRSFFVSSAPSGQASQRSPAALTHLTGRGSGGPSSTSSTPSPSESV